jgi:hypothetical protein
MEKPIYTEKIGNFSIEIHTDDDPQNPVENFDMLSIFALVNHRNYKVTTKDCQFSDLRELQEHFKELKNDVVYLPVRLYDHSGLTCSTSGGYPYNDSWDSGLWGYVFITKEKALKEFSCKNFTKKIKDKCIKIMQSEVQYLDDYLINNVYGYQVKDNDGEILDSCWGFWGNHEKGKDSYSDCLDEAKSIAQWHIDNGHKELAEKRGAMLNGLSELIKPMFALS